MESVPGPECECHACLFGGDAPERSSRRVALLGPGLDPGRAVLVDHIANVIWEIYEATRHRALTSYVIFETELTGGAFYVQLLARANEEAVWWEFASGFYGGDPRSHRTTAEERAALVKQGFSDGSDGNHSREVMSRDAPEARAVAEEIMVVLERVMGWSPRWPMTMRVIHEPHARGDATAACAQELHDRPNAAHLARACGDRRQARAIR